MKRHHISMGNHKTMRNTGIAFLGVILSFFSTNVYCQLKYITCNSGCSDTVGHVTFANKTGTTTGRWDVNSLVYGGLTNESFTITNPTSFTYTPTGNLITTGGGTYCIVTNPATVNGPTGLPLANAAPTTTNGGIFLIRPNNTSTPFANYKITGLQVGGKYCVRVKMRNATSLFNDPNGCNQSIFAQLQFQTLSGLSLSGAGPSGGMWNRVSDTAACTQGGSSGNWDGNNQVEGIVYDQEESWYECNLQLGLANNATDNGFILTFQPTSVPGSVAVWGIEEIEVYGCITQQILSSNGSSVCSATPTTLTAQGIGSTTDTYVWKQSTDGGTTYTLIASATSDTLSVIPPTTTKYSATCVRTGLTITTTITPVNCCGPNGLFTIPKVCDVITVDGNDIEPVWNTAPWQEDTVSYALDPTNTFECVNSNPTCAGVQVKPASKWRCVRTATDLYFDVRVNESNPQNAVQKYYQDAVEIYIASATNQPLQFGYPYASNGNPTFYNSNGAITGTSKIVKNATYWDLEVDIPIAPNNINITPGYINMEVAVNQAKDGGCTTCRAAQLFTWIASNAYSSTANYHVAPLSNCDGITATDSTVCGGGTTTLTTQLSTINSGLPYSWQQSIDGGITWTPVAGAGTSNSITVTPIVTTQYMATYDGVTSCPITINIGAITFMVTNPAPVCSPATADLTAAAITAGSQAGLTYTYFTDATATTALTNPSAVATSNTYYIKGQSSSCAGVQPVTVVINPAPTATISGATAVCQNATAPNITFTGANGTAPYTFTYNINSGTNLTVTTVSGNSVTVAAPASASGSFIYNLIAIKDASTTACSSVVTNQAATIAVNALPTATIGGTITVSVNTASPDVTFTGANGTAPYTFTYNINGGSNLTVTTVSGNSVTVAAPTTTAGSFAYNLINVKDASTTTCSNTASGTATITVSNLPTATISGTTAVCKNSTAPTITFTGAGGTAPYIFTYNINGGADLTVTTVSGNSVTLNAPTAATGTFAYTLTKVQESSTSNATNTITGQAITITVNDLPTATISGTTSVKINSASPDITFAGANGVAPYTFTYNINGGSNLTATTVTGNSVTIAVPTSSAGTFAYNLVSVKDASTTTCSNVSSGTATVTVSNLPTATITGSTAVCKNSTAPTITFTGANGMAPYTFTYTINGGTDLTATTVSGNSVTITAPTAAIGNFVYTLTKVQESSTSNLSNTITGQSITITVNDLPLATISGTTSVCQNATAPNITFTGSNGTAPYTFIYNINGGANLTATSVSGNSVTVVVPTSATGSFAYDLVGVKDASATSCSSVITNQVATVTVNALPTATIIGTTGVCQNATAPTITFTGSNGTAPYTFTYNINGGAVLTATTVLGNSTTVAAPAGAVGSFVYTLTGITDANTTSCNSNNITGQAATITVNALPTIAGTTGICSGTASQLQGTGIAAVSNAWSSSALSVATVNTTGYVTGLSGGTSTITYTDNNGCKASTTVTVSPLLVVKFAPLTSVCEETTPFLLTGGSENSGATGTGAYSGPGVFSDSLSPQLAGNGPHTIVYTFTSNGCSDTATQNITIYPAPSIDYGSVQSVLEGDSITLNPVQVSETDLQYLWTPYIYLSSNSIESPIVKPADDITYNITAISPGGCRDSTTLTVKVLKDFNVPNTFTPNNDGINDTWVIENLAKYPIQWVQVFDRYGQLLYESHGYSTPWDGTYKGKQLPSGTYYYIIELNGLRTPKTGYVTIIR